MVKQILHNELNVKVCEEMVPKILTANQNEKSKNICSNILQGLQTGPNLPTIIVICDETWISQYDLKLNANSFTGRFSTNEKILIVFFDIQGLR